MIQVTKKKNNLKISRIAPDPIYEKGNSSQLQSPFEIVQNIAEKDIYPEENYRSFSSSEREDSTLMKSIALKRSRSYNGINETKYYDWDNYEESQNPIVNFYKKKFDLNQSKNLKNKFNSREYLESQRSEIDFKRSYPPDFSKNTGRMKSTVSVNKLTVDFGLSNPKSPQNCD